MNSVLTVFNRREVLVTFSSDEFARAREALAHAQINYVLRIVNLESAKGWGPDRRSTYGSLGMNQQYTKQYVLFVHKRDYVEAERVLASAGRG